MTFTFDIETAGRPKPEQLAMFEPKFTPNGRLTDPQKIKADLIEKENEWLDTAALDAARGQVLVIGILHDDGGFHTFGLPDERTNLLNFWTLWNENRKEHKFVGHYIKGFDLPFMVRRSFMLDIPIPTGLREKRYFHDSFIDTMDLWACGTRDTISLDNLARSLGVGKKSGGGRDFAKFWNGDAIEHDAALAYLENDLRLTKDCYIKMTGASNG